MQPAPMPPQPAPQPPPRKGAPTWIFFVIGGGCALVGVLGILSPLAIYGVRRYLAASKTAEAKNTVGAISRGAAAAYENKNPPVLCRSAAPVPSSPASVSGMKYMPSSAPGSDFDTGDASTGWICLKFMLTAPMYYQYHYNQGSGYLGTVAPPGPDGFEAAAVGDLDADGVRSTFSRTGRVDPSGSLQMATQIAITNEHE